MRAGARVWVLSGDPGRRFGLIRDEMGGGGRHTGAPAGTIGGTMRREWIDVSMPVRGGMPHWPGDPAPRIERIAEVGAGDPATVSQIAFSVHTGTHVDAPLHFIAGGRALDEMPLDAVIGPARVIEVRDRTAIGAEELRRHAIRRGERVLLRTRNSERAGGLDRFTEEFVTLAADGARFLAARGVRVVGIDALSIDRYGDRTFGSHHALLGAGIWIIEGLDLSGVAPGRYELVCLPLRIADCEAAPARAALFPARPSRAARARSPRRPAREAAR